LNKKHVFNQKKNFKKEKNFFLEKGLLGSIEKARKRTE